MHFAVFGSEFPGHDKVRTKPLTRKQAVNKELKSVFQQPPSHFLHLKNTHRVQTHTVKTKAKTTQPSTLFSTVKTTS